MIDFDEISFNSNFSTGYNSINGIFNLNDHFQKDFTCKENELGIPFFQFHEKQSFEKEIELAKELEPKYLMMAKKAEEISEQNKKMKFVLEKENQGNIIKYDKNNIYRKDAYYKHFKAIFARYIKNKANRLKNICFPHFDKNNFSALSYKYTGNPKEKDNFNFLSFSIKDLLIYGKNEKIKNRQYNNELIIKYIETNKNIAKDKCFYSELVNFLTDTVENQLIKFYRNKKEFEFINKDNKCLFFDKYFIKETGVSLLERDGFIQILNKKYK